MPTYSEKAARLNETVDVAMLAIIEDTLLGTLIFLLCLWLLTRATRAWRYSKSGIQKDESLVLVVLISFGSLLLAGLIMAIYFDLKRAAFGGVLSHTWFLG